MTEWRWVGSCLVHKRLTRVKMLTITKRASLLRTTVKSPKMFYQIVATILNVSDFSAQKIT
jgi:hypothetical protein